MKKLILFLAFLAFSYPAYAVQMPDLEKTPGEVLTANTEIICIPGYSTTVRHTSKWLKSKVYEDYGIKTKEDRKKYILDHYIPLQLGGDDSERNLWPQNKVEAKQKDIVEGYLKREVCKGSMNIKEAQKSIVKDWTQFSK